MAKKKEIIVEINNLSKKYGKRENFAIEGINIECYAGEIVGLVGKNGAGKSTTIKCLTGFFPFEEGEVKICGHDIKKKPIDAKKNLGYVPDNRATFEKMTGIEYINFIADIHGVSLPRRVARISEMQEIFKLNDKINDVISSYSHGMKQKICLMASLIHSPKLWLLDEPLTGLDPQTSKALHQYMNKYKKEGNTVLYSSHNLYAIEKTCDRVYIIKQGKIVANINIAEFIKENPDKSLETVFMSEFED
jgi:ABC-2 type transport system ATP-binding protein